MAASSYDVIVVGAGHNGLTAAAYLARAGRRALVLERRDAPGGTLSAGTLAGQIFDAVQSGGLRPAILRDLGLKHPAPAADPAYISLLPDGARLELSRDFTRSADSIRRFSEKDARHWPEFVRFMDRAAAFLERSYGVIIPPLPRPPLDGALEMAGLGLNLRGMGRQDMMNTIRALAMPVFELVEEHFESEPLRAAICGLGVHGLTLGPYSAGTAFNLIHNWMNRAGPAHRFTGRAGEVTQGLVDALRGRGSEIRTGAEVSSILVEGGRCTGVLLAGGEVIAAEMVISALDPRRTFLSLVGPMELPPEFVWSVQNIKMRGSTAKVHLALGSPPEGLAPGATYVLAPSVRGLEQAYDAAKYGEVSAQPYLEATAVGKVLSIHFQYAPFELKGGGWEAQRPALEELAVTGLAAHFPGLEALIQSRQSLLPSDLEAGYGLTEGDLNHGQLMLDQIFFMRPIPGYADHHTPVDGLYLGGAGMHGGGGVSGIAGRNAARAVQRAA